MYGPTGNVLHIRVYPVDISSGGMAFFTGMFIHDGSVFSLNLLMADGKMMAVKGVSTRCTFLKGRAHEVGLKFTEHFDMGLIVPSGMTAELGSIPDSDATEPGETGSAPGLHAASHGSPHPSAGGAASAGQPHAETKTVGVAHVALTEIKLISAELVEVVTKLTGRIESMVEPR